MAYVNKSDIYKLFDESNGVIKLHIADVDMLSTADVVEVKHGEWVTMDCISKSKKGRTIHYATNKCSVCGKWNGRHKPNYCPHCGAKMDVTEITGGR